MGVPIGLGLGLLGLGANIFQSRQANKEAKKQAKRQQQLLSDTQEESVGDTERIVTEERGKKRRVNLFETQGSVLGQELQPSQVRRRDTIFGN